VNIKPKQPLRLDSGGRIDRSRLLNFTFNGTPLTGYEGDTLASALLANGIRVIGRSFKYHRPRGVFTSGEEEPCALVELGEGDARIPTCRAPMVPLTEGLVANSQNCWPSVNFDAGRVIDFTRAFWPAGFYNKTFKWPSWKTWENLVRRTAGLGRPLDGPDPDHYEQVNIHCDLLICGGGPAGLQAALLASRAGLRVVLAEQSDEFGGMLQQERVCLDGVSGPEWTQKTVHSLQASPGVLMLPATTVSGIYDHNVTTLLQSGRETAWRECYWTVRPRHILLTTGAIEQGLIFPNNDRPGIMLAGAVRHYLNRYAVCTGKNIVVVTNNDTAYQTVFDLASNNMTVSAVIDYRDQVSQSLRQRLSDLGTELIPGCRVGNTRGSQGIDSVLIERMDGNPVAKRKCDLLAVSGGWAPRVHLLAHARGELRFDPVSQSFLPGRLPSGLTVAGAANGTSGLEESLAEASRAASSICASLGRNHDPVQPPVVTTGVVESREVFPVQINAKKSHQFIDLAHDVTFGDAELAVREGYVAVEHFKRFTTTGMSVDQGKTGNLNAFIVLGKLTGRSPGDVGTTTFRPPYMPVTLGAIAGRHTGELYAPRRFLPAHVLHEQLNARMADYGWQRPDFYPVPTETSQDAIRREARNVRTHCGVFDNSPIGKLEVRGPDAAEFLNRLYINNVHSLAPGRVRYGLMLNENGVILDDGVFSRLSENHFLLNTTSAGVSRVAAMMEQWLQCEWTHLQVLVDDVTTQWANFTIAGPRARDVLTDLGTSVDISASGFPHMSFAIGTVAGIAARIVRVSFSGEVSFEVNVPAAQATRFLSAALDAGAAYQIAPYGIEALMMLRLEKGYLHVGSDTDGSSTPDDVGWGRVARAKTSDYIGKRSLLRPGNQDQKRKQFVGLEPLDPDQAIRPGGHLLSGTNRQPPAETEGWVTSACFSANLDRYIALGVLRDGRNRAGETFTVCDEDLRYPVRVVSPVFYDPEGVRLNG